MNEVRCEKCNVLLFKEDIMFGETEVKCRSCGEMNYFTFYLDNLFSGI